MRLAIKSLRSAASVAVAAFVYAFALPSFAQGVANPSIQNLQCQANENMPADSLLSPIIEVMTQNNPALVYVDWWETDDPLNVVRVFLTKSGSLWTGNLPVNHAGNARYIVYAEDAAGNAYPYKQNGAVVVGKYVIEENNTDPKGMTNQRCPNLQAWILDNSSGVADVDSDWYGEEIRKDSSIPQLISLLGTTTAQTPLATKANRNPIVAGGFVRTSDAVKDGVGSLWFKARMGSTNSLGGTLSVERIPFSISERTGRKIFEDPQEIEVVQVPRARAYDQWQQFHLILQDNPGTNFVYRIRNKTMADNEAERTVQAIDVCDIVLTPLIPDVAIVKDEMDYDPGYPSIQDPVTFRVSVSNLYAAAPAQHITPRIVWRQGEFSAWHTNIMVHADVDGGRTNQEPGEFFVTLTPADGLVDGPFEYFYTVSFTGYTPSFPALKYPTFDVLNNIRNFEYDWDDNKYLIHTNAWALLTDAAGNVSECRAPAYYPDFTGLWTERALGEFGDYAWSRDVVPGSAADEASFWGYTRAFDLWKLDEGWPIARKAHFAQRAGLQNTVYPNRAIEIEGEFPYNRLMAADGVRRFRSLYTGLAAKTMDHPDAERPSLLADAYAMQHVGDYTWQAIIHITNAVDSLFSVTGGLYAAEGGTNFVAGPFEWLQIDQPETAINPPMSGEMEIVEQNGVIITNHNELQRFTTHPEERIRRIPVDVEYAETNLTTGSGWFVGIVTNGLWSGKTRDQWPTDPDTGAVVEPGVGDVAFWYGVLAEEPAMVEDPDTHEMVEGVETNIVADILWNEVVSTNLEYQVDLTVRTNEVRTLLQRSEFDGYYDWGPRVVVTNRFASEIVTNATFVKKTRREWIEEPYTVWEPDFDEETIDREHRTRVQIDYDGFLMFRFCTTNGSYQIRRAAWQDFNEWQAAETNFSLSFGLYGVKDFTSDLSGRATTEFSAAFASDFIDGLAPTSEWSDPAEGTYWSGLIGKNARVVEERQRADTDAGDPTSKRRNKAFLLKAHPSAEGSLQTTSVRAENGRDTLNLRVRSSTDDARNIVWTAAPLSSENYRVMARIADPSDDQVSDGEHSLSLIGYWQSPYDYWEARIVQKSSLSGDKSKPLRNWFEVHIYQWADGECTEVFGAVSQSGMFGDSYTATEANPATFPGWRNSGNAERTNNYWDNPAVNGSFLRTADGGWTFVFELSTEGSAVTPVVWAYYTADLAKATPKTDRFFKFTGGSTTGGTTSGRPGYNMRDCGLVVVPYVQPLESPISFANTSASAFSGIKDSAKGDWYLTDKATYDSEQKIDVWTVGKAAVSGTAYTSLTREAPVVYFGIEVFRTGREVETNLFTAPVNQQSIGMPSGWDDEWDDYHRPFGTATDGIQSVASWKWVTRSFPMNFWDETFLNVRAHAANGNDKSKGMLAVDSLSCDEWRGKTVWDPKDSEPDARAKQRSELGDGWTATYAAIVADGRTGRKYELNRSRANPNRIQAITTPPLENGVGDITFRCQAINYKVKVSVELGDASGFWQSSPDKTVELSPTEAPVPLYFLFATNIEGRIRIRVLDPDGMGPGQLGTLYVDDIRATDYPAAGESSWEVYNALVSTFPTNYTVPRGWDRNPKFDGVSSAAVDMRSAVLNDGVDRETLSGYPLTEHAPHLQTPSIETGVGEISFWYRASPDNGNPPSPARIRLMVSESSRIADGDWRQLTIDDLYYDNKKYSDPLDDPNYVRQKNALEALESITNNTTWTYFNVEFFDEKDRVLRIVGETNGAPNRVMLDNVLITEPVRSSIDVGTIEFDPGIPLNTKSTGAKVTLVNPRMNPHDIEVKLHWYVADTSLEPYDIETELVTVEKETRTIYTNVVWNGQVYEASFPHVTYHTNRTPVVETTLVSSSLKTADLSTRKWGWDKWQSVPEDGRLRGTIGFTNAWGQTYVFLSTNRIPTDTFPADTVFQYCVEVRYEGSFKAPVYSETQGRVKNGFWFETPAWYSPIDLNYAFGTAERPVAHAFAFTCPTNVVRINEFRPWLGSTKKNRQDEQFVEFMGPEGVKIEGWRLEHWWAMKDGAIDATWINHTNSIHAMFPTEHDAVFKASTITNVVPPKRWGFYILGCSSIENRDQELFSLEDEQRDKATLGDHPFINTVGAMRLRRAMGAYVDGITWGTSAQTKPMRESGFLYAGNISSPLSDSKIGYVYLLDASNDSFAFRNASRAAATIGGYNGDEEAVLPWLNDEYVAPPVPLIGQPVITGLTFEGAPEGYVNLTFEVCVTNGVELKADSGYRWVVDARTSLDDRASEWTPHAELDPVAAPEDGTTVVVGPIAVRALQDALFYRIKAIPKE